MLVLNMHFDMNAFQIWVARADCDSQYKDAVPITLEQIDVIKRFIDSNSDDLQLVTSIEGK